jgi:hypothetical protein
VVAHRKQGKVELVLVNRSGATGAVLQCISFELDAVAGMRSRFCSTRSILMPSPIADLRTILASFNLLCDR